MKTERNQTMRILRDGSAYTGLTGAVFFWIPAALSFVPRFRLPQLTGFQMFKILGMSLVLAAVALLLQAKPWRVAPPFALVMFFFAMYAMGS